jgi:hypothetical protein
LKICATALVLLAVLFFGACAHSPGQPEAGSSVSPTTGGGAKQVFTVVFSDPKGVQHIELARILVNRWVDGSHACYVEYFRAENAFVLINDAGDGSTRMKAGDAGELSNSQCSLAGPDSSASVSGSRLKLVLGLHFKPAFKGESQIFLATRSVAGEETPFQRSGSWSASSSVHGDSIPVAVSVTPQSGSGWNEIFTFTYSSSNGASDLVDLRALFNRSLDGSDGCYVEYAPATDSILLINDAGDGSTAIPLGSGLKLANSQCIVSAAGSSVSSRGSTLVWKLSVTFKPPFAGTKQIFLSAATDNSKNSGFQKLGTWSVPYLSP